MFLNLVIYKVSIHAKIIHKVKKDEKHVQQLEWDFNYRSYKQVWFFALTYEFFPQNEHVYLECWVTSIFLMTLRSVAPYLVPYFPQMPTFKVLLPWWYAKETIKVRIFWLDALLMIYLQIWTKWNKNEQNIDWNEDAFAILKSKIFGEICNKRW
jgi:hypothetical protein